MAGTKGIGTQTSNPVPPATKPDTSGKSGRDSGGGSKNESSNSKESGITRDKSGNVTGVDKKA